MEEIKTSENSKTTFSRDDGLPWIKKLALAVLFIAIVVCVITAFGRISSKGRAAINHAKQIRVAMKLISLEYYNGDGSIFDPTSEDGLSAGALARIKAVTTVDGEIILNSWDTENDIPISFSYREGRYLVEYRQSGSVKDGYGANGTWSVYYDLKIMEYASE